MNQPFQGLRTAIYHVDPLAEATEWYSRVLDSAPYFNEPFYVGFNVGGFELGLVPAEHGKTPGVRSVDAYWGVLDIQAAYDRLIAMGATSCEPPTNVGGGIYTATVFDPWQNVLGIIYNPHFQLAGPLSAN